MRPCLLLLLPGAAAFSAHNACSDTPTRREALQFISGALASSCLLAPTAALAAPAPLQTSAGIVRVEEIGGGLDLLSPQPLSASEVFYPSSMIDTKWKVQRVVTSVEGDVGQAALAWKLLGGSDERAFTSKLTEAYEARFVAAPETMKDASYEFEGKALRAAILDRGYEMSSRTGLQMEDIRWNIQSNAIDYTRDKDAVNLTVVRRKIEPPSETGFGSDEVYRIQSSAGGDIRRHQRLPGREGAPAVSPGFDESTGKRMIDCIEITTTHRVLDGIAGIELPTSTTKSRLRFTQL